MAKNKYWFKAKKYGWGWYPSSWEGYTIVGIYISVFIVLFYNIDVYSHSATETILSFIPQAFIITIVLIGTCFIKGEKPHWNYKKRS